MEKKISSLMEEKKEHDKKHRQIRCELDDANGEVEAVKFELEEEKNDWEIQKKRYTTVSMPLFRKSGTSRQNCITNTRN